jgi:hypothetical protein
VQASYAVTGKVCIKIVEVDSLIHQLTQSHTDPLWLIVWQRVSTWKNYLKPSTPSCGISYTVDCLHPHLLVLALRGEIWENCSSDLVKNLVSRRSAWILSSENFGFLCFVSHGLSSSQPPKRWTLPRSTARGEPRGGFFPSVRCRTGVTFELVVHQDRSSIGPTQLDRKSLKGLVLSIT